MQVGAIVSPRRCMVNQPDPVSPQLDSSCCAPPGPRASARLGHALHLAGMGGRQGRVGQEAEGLSDEQYPSGLKTQARRPPSRPRFFVASRRAISWPNPAGRIEMIEFVPTIAPGLSSSLTRDSSRTGMSPSASNILTALSAESSSARIAPSRSRTTRYCAIQPGGRELDVQGPPFSRLVLLAG
jgi:hypothetical protein